MPTGGGTHWEPVAEWYDELVGDKGSEYHREVVIPGVLRMLAATTTAPRKHERHENPRKEDKTREEYGGEKKRGLQGLRVLDLACGQGVLCRRLAEEGCMVVGVDASPALIEAARVREAAESRGGSAIRYAVGDATKLLGGGGGGSAGSAGGLVAGGFDAVTIVLAVQNMTPLSPVWQACWELLRPGGVVVVVMMHPCFRVPQHSDWHWDERAGAGGGGCNRGLLLNT